MSNDNETMGEMMQTPNSEWREARYQADDIQGLRSIIEDLKQTMIEAANKCNGWAAQSVKGGWSTHQVRENQELATKLYAKVDQHAAKDGNQ